MIRGCMTSYQAEPAEWRVTGEGLGSPSGGERPLLEADLVMAGGAAMVVRVALGVSSWNGRRRPCEGGLGPPGCRVAGIGLWSIRVDVHLVRV